MPLPRAKRLLAITRSWSLSWSLSPVRGPARPCVCVRSRRRNQTCVRGGARPCARQANLGVRRSQAKIPSLRPLLELGIDWGGPLSPVVTGPLAFGTEGSVHPFRGATTILTDGMRGGVQGDPYAGVSEHDAASWQARALRRDRVGASTGRLVVMMARTPAASRARKERVIIQISSPPASAILGPSWGHVRWYGLGRGATSSDITCHNRLSLGTKWPTTGPEATGRDRPEYPFKVETGVRFPLGAPPSLARWRNLGPAWRRPGAGPTLPAGHWAISPRRARRSRCGTDSRT